MNQAGSDAAPCDSEDSSVKTRRTTYGFVLHSGADPSVGRPQCGQVTRSCSSPSSTCPQLKQVEERKQAGSPMSRRYPRGRCRGKPEAGLGPASGRPETQFEFPRFGVATARSTQAAQECSQIGQVLRGQ